MRKIVTECNFFHTSTIFTAKSVLKPVVPTKIKLLIPLLARSPFPAVSSAWLSLPVTCFLCKSVRLTVLFHLTWQSIQSSSLASPSQQLLPVQNRDLNVAWAFLSPQTHRKQNIGPLICRPLSAVVGQWVTHRLLQQTQWHKHQLRQGKLSIQTGSGEVELVFLGWSH